MTGFRRLYGSNPLHLIGHLAVFFVAGWAIDQIIGGGTIINWMAWFVGAALLHDLVLLPLYSLADRGLVNNGGNRVARAARRRTWVNYIRVPAAISAILLLVYFPVILGYSSTNYRNDTGHSLTGYTRNWLLVTAGLFVGSALIYVVRSMRRRPSSPRPAREQSSG
jgi:Na+/melibiose symporter-like transporter